jgi:hypothetical protein
LPSRWCLAPSDGHRELVEGHRDATLAFALGIPAHHTRSAGSDIDVDWDDEAIDDADEIGGLEDDVAEDADDRAIETAQETPQLHRAVESIRRRYRGVAERMIRNWRDPDPHERLLALRFALFLVAGGAWPSSDESWLDLLLDGVIGLDIAEPSSEYEEPAGNLAALVLSIVRSRLGTTEHTPTHARFDRAADGISHLLVAAEPDRIAQYGKGLEGRFPAFSHPDIVLDLRDRLVADDPSLTRFKRLTTRASARRRSAE